MRNVRRTAAAIWILAMTCAQAAAQVIEPRSDWPTYGGEPLGQHHSTLRQIDERNVATLRGAWKFQTGVVSDFTSFRSPDAKDFSCGVTRRFYSRLLPGD